jgi:hypothetical protein
MAYFVYILCALTSLSVTCLLAIAYRKTRSALLFWSALAFLAFSLTNVLLFVDLAMVPDVDLILWRNSATLIGVVVLLYGLIKGDT